MKKENLDWLIKIKTECQNIIDNNKIFEGDKENLMYWANKLEVE